VARAVVDEHLGREDRDAGDEHGGHEPRPPPALLLRGRGRGAGVRVRGRVLVVPRGLPLLAAPRRHGWLSCRRPPPRASASAGYSYSVRGSGLVGGLARLSVCCVRV